MLASAITATRAAGGHHLRRHDGILSAVPSVYIGMGGNLDNPRAHIQRALLELDHLPETHLQAHAGLYKSSPLGPQDQPEYFNTVALLATGLEPLTLLHTLAELEQLHGRRRSTEKHWGARCLDLDILIYDDVRMESPELTLPHPHMHERSFVLYPLAELAPELVIPGRGAVRSLRDQCHTPRIERCEETVNG